MTLTEERRLIESRHPNWHLWFTPESSKPMATRTGGSPFGGSGVTLELPGMARADQLLAAFDFAVEHGWDPWEAVADAVTRSETAGAA